MDNSVARVRFIRARITFRWYTQRNPMPGGRSSPGKTRFYNTSCAICNYLGVTRHTCSNSVLRINRPDPRVPAYILWPMREVYIIYLHRMYSWRLLLGGEKLVLAKRAEKGTRWGGAQAAVGRIVLYARFAGSVAVTVIGFYYGAGRPVWLYAADAVENVSFVKQPRRCVHGKNASLAAT